MENKYNKLKPRVTTTVSKDTLQRIDKLVTENRFYNRSIVVEMLILGELTLPPKPKTVKKTTKKVVKK